MPVLFFRLSILAVQEIQDQEALQKVCRRVFITSLPLKRREVVLEQTVVQA